MKKAKLPKEGDIVEIKWVDAVFHSEVCSSLEKSVDNGGDVMTLVGYVYKQNKKGLTLCGELDEDGKPHRDFNVIPLGMVKSIRIIKKRS